MFQSSLQEFWKHFKVLSSLTLCHLDLYVSKLETKHLLKQLQAESKSARLKQGVTNYDRRISSADKEKGQHPGGSNNRKGKIYFHLSFILIISSTGDIQQQTGQQTFWLSF